MFMESTRRPLGPAQIDLSRERAIDLTEIRHTAARRKS